LNAPHGKVVKAEFLALDVEVGNDFFNLYDGTSELAPLIYSANARFLPAQTTYYSTGRQMFIRWNTDATVLLSGAV